MRTARTPSCPHWRDEGIPRCGCAAEGIPPPVTTSIAPPLHSNGTHLHGARATLRVGVVSTYPPRACGIGTFSQDLRHALLGTDSVSAVDVAAVVREGDARQAAEVVTCIHQDQRREYAAAAQALESRGSDVVIIEHEYGIFGGPDGAHVLSLASELRQPMVLTLHTVLSSPHAAQAETLRALCDRATLVCVFTETARRMVVDARLVSPDRIRVVPHGCPDRRRCPSPARRPPSSSPGTGAADTDGRGPVLATFGLISPGKGIETAIAAMPAIVARHPERALRRRRPNPSGGRQGPWRGVPDLARGPRARPRPVRPRRLR